MSNPNPRTDQIQPYQIKPGEVRNPQGYSRGRRAVDDLLDLIAEKGADRAIALKWLEMILKGDHRFLASYLDRRDGKVKDQVEVKDTTDQTVKQIGLPDNGRGRDDAAPGGAPVEVPEQ